MPKLPQVVNLNGNWEVGLYSITYLHTWYTLKKGLDTHIYETYKSGLPTPIFVDYGLYEKAFDLVKAINETLDKKVKDNIQLSFGPEQKKLKSM